MAKRSKPQENKKIRKIPDAYIAGAGTGRSSVKIRYRNVKMYISPMTENG